jgi:AraC-like DNA-binding protein
MRTSKTSAAGLARIRHLPPPTDYFAETRSSLELWPEKILCFSRKSHRSGDLDTLVRYRHHRYVLVVPWREAGEVYVEDRRFLLTQSQALLILPFQFHHGFDFRRHLLVWQFVTFEMRDGAALEGLRLQPVRKFESDDFKLLSSLADAWGNPRRQDELAHWLGLVLARLLAAPPAGKKWNRRKPKNTDPLLIRINQQCIPLLDRLFGIKELAALLFMSESHLRARFREATGLSLGAHLRQLRLQKAMGLLVQSNLTVTQIAAKCGFDSIFTFSRSFRHFVGTSARDYRRRYARFLRSI